MSSLSSCPRCVPYTRSLSTRTSVTCRALPPCTDGASWTSAQPADEDVPGDTSAQPPFQDLLEVDALRQFPDGRFGRLEQPRLVQQLGHLVPALLHRTALLPGSDVAGTCAAFP